MSSQSLRDECKALDESREFISWFQRHFPTVPCEVIVAFEENTITGEDFLDMDEQDFKEVFPRLAHRKIVKGIYNCVNGSVSDPISTGMIKASVVDASKQSASQSDCFSDDESEVSVQSTLTLSSSSGGCMSDDSLSSGKERTSTPIPKKVSNRPVSVLSKPKARLPSGFVIPSKFGKVTDGNLKSGNITDVDRAKVIKTVATCVWVYTDTPSPGCCEWLAKQLISKYPILADADPRKMVNREQTVPAPKEDFKYWYSLKKGIMKKFENWRYRENKRSPDFVEQKARKKKKTEEDLDSDPAVMERNIKRLKDEQSKSRGQDGGVLQNLLSVTFSARHQQLVAVSDGKSRVSKFLKDWPILGQEIYFKEELSRALSKAKVPVSDFSATVDNWKKVIPNIILMLGDVCALEDDIPTVNFVSDEGKFRMLSKFVSEKDARGAISNDITLDEALVEVLPTEWKLEDDELPLVPHVKKYFSESAWLIVEDGLKRLKQQANTGDEIKALLSLTKLFPGVKKLKDTGSDFIVNVAENGKSVTEFLKKPPSTSPYLIICRRGNGWQTFLACGGHSILETSTISTGVAALIGSYYLFNFEYPSEAKGAFLFLQEYLLNDFVNQRHSKYAAALVRYQTAAMKNSNSSMASNSAMAVPE